MSEIYEKYLTKDQQEALRKLPDERRWNNYRNFDLELETWDKFWTSIYRKFKDRTDPISVLDFGCGAAYCEVVATTLEKNINITSVDINTEEVKIVFGRFHKVLGVKAEYWDGNVLPFTDGKFDVIISKASLSKLVNTSWKTTLSELTRVTAKDGLWYLAPHYMCERLIENIADDTRSEMLAKNVTLCAWSWNLDDPRNKYWRNKGIVTPDGLGEHDDDYVDRNQIGPRMSHDAKAMATILADVMKKTEDD